MDKVFLVFAQKNAFFFAFKCNRTIPSNHTFDILELWLLIFSMLNHHVLYPVVTINEVGRYARHEVLH